MIVNDVLNEIKASTDYVTNSLYLKSSDDYGCVYKWLVKGATFATRKEVFMAFDSEDSAELLNKTVLDYVEVYPACSM